MEAVLLVITTVPNAATGAVIARRLVEHRLAACVNQLPFGKSVYRWQGVVEEADEGLLVIKTTATRYPELEAALKAMHPYDVPEIVALPTAAGLPAYLAWISQETKKDVDV